MCTTPAIERSKNCFVVKQPHDESTWPMAENSILLFYYYPSSPPYINVCKEFLYVPVSEEVTSSAVGLGGDAPIFPSNHFHADLGVCSCCLFWNSHLGTLTLHSTVALPKDEPHPQRILPHHKLSRLVKYPKRKMHCSTTSLGHSLVSTNCRQEVVCVKGLFCLGTRYHLFLPSDNCGYIQPNFYSTCTHPT